MNTSENFEVLPYKPRLVRERIRYRNTVSTSVTFWRQTPYLHLFAFPFKTMQTSAGFVSGPACQKKLNFKQKNWQKLGTDTETGNPWADSHGGERTCELVLYPYEYFFANSTEPTHMQVKPLPNVPILAGRTDFQGAVPLFITLCTAYFPLSLEQWKFYLRVSALCNRAHFDMVSIWIKSRSARVGACVGIFVKRANK